jgi:YfiH family protein
LLASPIFKPYDWLDHGFGTRDSQIAQDSMASLKQMHSARVLRVSGIGCAGEADALITNTPGVSISIRTADCFPILLADLEHHTVAAVHAGWRGTAEQIVTRTLDAMRTEFGTIPAQVVVAIGPGIGACCYEVGPDVAQKFGVEGTTRVDLAAINRDQLLRAGVPAGQIDTLGCCTKCDPERFHSYRRDGEAAGRMISYIAMK